MSPLIIAKALNIEIIICKSVTVDNVKEVKLHHMNCSRETNNGIIVIYKNGMHYDAIVGERLPIWTSIKYGPPSYCTKY